jgi:sterol desaturase/sphingolipid hydroxylase (fatty acid hydroxylase superfamily)
VVLAAHGICPARVPRLRGIVFELLVSISVIFGIDALLIGLLVWAYHSPRFAHKRISGANSLRVPWSTRAQVMGAISTLSLLTVFATLYAFYGSVVHGGRVGAFTVAWQTIGVLLVYDFSYYFLHRLMHAKKLMRWVHGVHHRARNPSALESFYLHPLELMAGLGLFFASIWVMGPVHVHSFIVAFFIYSTMNILVHAGIVLGGAMLWPIDFLAKKHHVHHMDDFGKNYASLTPLPDLLFGTAG